MGMRIRLLRNLGRGFPPYRTGEEHDVDQAFGERLCKQGLAERIHAVPAPPLKAVPPEKPEGTAEKATADLVAYKEKQKKKPDA